MRREVLLACRGHKSSPALPMAHPLARTAAGAIEALAAERTGAGAAAGAAEALLGIGEVGGADGAVELAAVAG